MIKRMNFFISSYEGHFSKLIKLLRWPTLDCYNFFFDLKQIEFFMTIDLRGESANKFSCIHIKKRWHEGEAKWLLYNLKFI